MTTAGARLDHDAIAARIPHAGPMCLLDQAVSWDESRIECTAFARPPRHPDDTPHLLSSVAVAGTTARRSVTA